MSSDVHRVEFFETTCIHCRRTFSTPLLSDQSYGLFIFHGERGDVFGFLSAFDEPACEDIRNRLKRAGLFSDTAVRMEVERFQRVIAASADPIHRQALELFPSCPACHSDSVSHDDSKSLGVQEIPRVTFREYELLSDEQKMTKLCELWGKSD